MTKRRRTQPEPENQPQDEGDMRPTPEPTPADSAPAEDIAAHEVDADATLTLERPAILDAPTETDFQAVTPEVQKRLAAEAAAYRPSAQSDDLSELLSSWSRGDPGTDIDAALAAVSSLSDLMAEQEAAEEARAEARRPAPAVYRPTLPVPPLSSLRRGSLGSLVPALLLIGGGAWLTLTLTSGATVEPLTLAALLVGGIALSLLAEWLGTRRWSRGTLLGALVIAAVAGVVAFSLQPGGIDLVRGWPLLLGALGVALGLAGVLARPLDRRALVPGLLLVGAGALGLAFTGGYAPGDLLPTLVPYAPAGLVVLAVVWAVPLVFRRRG